MKKKFKFLEHTADIKFKVWGKNLDEIFENCAGAFSYYLSGEKKIKNLATKKISLSGTDNESLLYNFIDELIYLLDAKNFVVSKAKVRIKNNKLRGEVFGDSASRYSGLDYIKAATYAEMYVKKIKSGRWEAQVVLDV